MQLDLQINNAQNFQKIKLYGSPTQGFEEDTFIQMRRGGVVEIGREAVWQGKAVVVVVVVKWMGGIP